MNNINVDGYQRVSKRTAERLYNSGTTLYLYACKVRPNNQWISPAKTNINTSDQSFENMVNVFEHYNCNYNELGKYTAFYIQEVQDV